MLVKDLAEWLGTSTITAWEGDGSHEIHRVAALEEAGPGELSFVANQRLARLAAESRAGCLIVPPDYLNQPSRTILRAPDPRAAIAKAIGKLHYQPHPEPGVHPSAVVAPGVHLGHGVAVGALTSIGEGACIGAGTAIGPGCVIAEGVHIGARCLLHANVTIYRDVQIGDEVILHSGCVLGADGFGFVMTGGAYQKFPQIGRVEIGDRVEIGATSCVDRAALGVTSIGEGTKIDNMVHIGHNCRVGKHVVIVAQAGLSGGVIVGDYAVIGGQVGIGDKVRIEARAVLGSGSGVLTSKIVRAGQVMWGTPARPLKQYLDQLAVLSRMAKKKRAANERE